MDKLWLGFDVDETLGHFTYLMPILDFLLLDLDGGYTYEPGFYTYRYLTRYVAKNERIPGKATGLFRPGLYNFFQKIKPLLENQTIQGMTMYSNNSNANVLSFCAYVIDEWIDNEKRNFCNLIHRNHISRKNKTGHISMEKKWSILQHSFAMNGCPPAENEKNTFFYDDSREHKNLMNHLGKNYILVKPYFGPVFIQSLLPLLQHSLLKSKILKKREGANNNALLGTDFIFDSDYITRLHKLYQHETTPLYLKEDLKLLFQKTGESPEDFTKVTWKDYQKTLQEIFKKSTSMSNRNIPLVGLDMKQWYDPLVTPPIEAERANAMIERMMQNRMRGVNSTRTVNHARSSSPRGNTAKKAPGRSLENMAANQKPYEIVYKEGSSLPGLVFRKSNPTPMYPTENHGKITSMENEMKEAFGLGGGRRRTRRSSRRKNASRKVKRHSRR